MRFTTKKDQSFQSFGCGQTHVVRFMGNCETCGNSVYSHGCAGAKPCGDVVEDSPDPRGVIPAGHCMNLYHASEYGMTGRDVMTCANCAEDSDKYRATMNAAVDSGTWKAVACTSA